MNKVIMGLFMVASMNVYAIDCASLSETAATVMEVRQMGYPMSKLMEAAERDGALARALVIEAYRQPRYSSDGYKENAIKDFANEVYLQCIEIIDSD